MKNLVWVLGFLFFSNVVVHASDFDAGLKAYNASEYPKALEIFSKAFQSGSAESGYYLGRMLELGLGVKADKVAASKIFIASAGQGHAASLNRVGLMHYRGENGVLQDFNEAFSYFKKSADQNDRNGLFNLGKLYFEGKGVKRDIPRAHELYEKAADLGHVGALNSLGFAYKTGLNVKQDGVRSLGYFRKAAALGNAVALFEVGGFYLRGKSVERSFEQAHLHFNLASSRGHPKASGALQALTKEMSDEQIKTAQNLARNWEKEL